MKKYLAHYNGQEIPISEEDAHNIYEAFKHNLLLEDAEENFKVEIDYACWFFDKDKIREFVEAYGYTPEQAMDIKSPHYRMERILIAFQNLKKTSVSEDHAWTAAVEAILNADEAEYRNHMLPLLKKAAEKFADEFFVCEQDNWMEDFESIYGFSGDDATDPVSPHYVLNRIVKAYQQLLAKSDSEDTAWYNAVHSEMKEIEADRKVKALGDQMAKQAAPVLTANGYSKKLVNTFHTAESRKRFLEEEGGGWHDFGGLDTNGDQLSIGVRYGDGFTISVFPAGKSRRTMHYNMEGIAVEYVSEDEADISRKEIEFPWYRSIPEYMAAQFGTVKGRKELIATYGKYCNTYTGKNNNQETILITIRPEGIKYVCYQENGFIRVNLYDADGLMTDELFEGRHKEG